jgi:hypothetical protein
MFNQDVPMRENHARCVEITHDSETVPTETMIPLGFLRWHLECLFFSLEPLAATG